MRFLKIVIDKDVQIKVFFNHIENTKAKKEIERVLDIAEDCKLVLKNEELSRKSGGKGIWTLKDFSEAVMLKRQK